MVGAKKEMLEHKRTQKKLTTLRWTPEIVHDFKSAGATISDVTCQYYVRVG